jgi:hypothetical protein
VLKKAKDIVPSEFWEQAMLFEWADRNTGTHPDLWLLNGSLNGVRLTIGQAVKCKRIGMKKGFPDISLPVPRGEYHGLYIELKRVKGSRLGKEQLEWAGKLLDRGYCMALCKGYREAVKIILDYLNLK